MSTSKTPTRKSNYVKPVKYTTESMVRVVRDFWRMTNRPATLAYIARKVGCHQATVYHRLRTEGIQELETVRIQVGWAELLAYAPRDRHERSKKKG